MRARTPTHRTRPHPAVWIGLVLAALAVAARPGAGAWVVENRGQMPEPVRYYTPMGPERVYFAAGSVVIDLPRFRRVLRIRIVGAEGAGIEPAGPLPGAVSVFLGNDPSRWRSALPLFSGVIYRGPDADLAFEVTGSGIVYRAVAHGGSASSGSGSSFPARLAYEGADRVLSAPDGSVRLEIPGAVLVDAPVDNGTARALRFTPLAEGGAAPERDNPSTLDWSTFVGGGNNDYSHALVLDAQARPIVAGYTQSSDFPVTPGAYDQTRAGSYDVFVAKLDLRSAHLVWATFIGGTLEDRPFAIGLDAGDCPVLTGGTYSSDFPTTPGAWDQSLNGPRDVFVCKLDATGSRLLWGTYLGGDEVECAWSVAVDHGGSPIVIGQTQSSNFPTTAGAWEPAYSGGVLDAFATCLAPEGDRLLWSTYLGGAGFDCANAIVIDDANCPIIAGTTHSPDFPVTPGAFDPTPNGGTDSFLIRLEAGGGTALYSSFLGGAGEDVVNALLLDAQGRPWLAGTTQSANFPVTTAAFDRTYNGAGDVFVTAFDGAWDRLAWSTYFGGGDLDIAVSIGRDRAGRPVLSGETSSADFPTTVNAYDRSYNGNRDAFVTRLDPTGSYVLWSTFLGGNQWESAWDLVVDPEDCPIVAGPTRSPDFPTTSGAYDRTYNGGEEDAFITRMVIPATSSMVPERPAASSLPARVEPNPSRQPVRITLGSPPAGPWRVRIVDGAGRMVSGSDRLVAPGSPDVVWPGEDASGRPVPAGVYWARIDSRGGSALIPLVRIR